MRSLFIVAFAALCLFFTLSAPATAQRYYSEGGVIPGSQDDAHYDARRRSWVPNRHPVRAVQAPRHRGHNRAGTVSRSGGTTFTATSFTKVTARKVGSFRVLVGQTIEQCVRSRVTGEIRC